MADKNNPSTPPNDDKQKQYPGIETTSFEVAAVPEEAYQATFQNFEEGQVVQGLIVKETENEFIVDVGLKSEGVISKDQFRREMKEGTVSVGDAVDVLIERTEDQDGRVQLSKEKADRIKIWNDIQLAFDNNERVIGRVIDKIKGGLSVDIGVRAFLPGSQTGLRNISQIDSLVGKEIEAKIIKLNPQRKNIVLSRKSVIEEDAEVRKAELINSLHEGNLVKGFVKNLTEYGAFIDLGGIDGLLHITDMSWGRINHPTEMFKVGDEVEVMVLKFDEEKERVSLGYKQRTEDPWKNVPEQFPVGSRVNGKVISLADYGAFIELKEGVEGLIHVSEMSWSKRLKHPSKMINVDDTVEAVVLDLDVTNKRISLGMKQIEPNPWDLAEEKFPIGSRVSGTVRNITNFGAFVEIDEGIDGLVHISDLSWTQRVKHPQDILNKGDEIEAVVLAIDRENERISLGLKQTESDPWEDITAKYPPASEVEGKVLRLTDYGAFVELEDGIEGLLPINEVERVKEMSPDEELEVDQTRTMRIRKIDEDERQILLSMVGFGDMDLEDYAKEMNTDELTLGDQIAADPSALSRLYEMAQKEKEEPTADEAPDKAEAETEAAPVAEAVPEQVAAEENEAVEEVDAEEAPAEATEAEPEVAEEEPAAEEAEVAPADAPPVEESPTEGNSEEKVTPEAEEAADEPAEADSGEKKDEDE